MFELYQCVVGVTVLFSFICICDVLENKFISRVFKANVISICIMLIIVDTCECIGVVTNGVAPNLIWLHKVSKLLEFCLAPWLAIRFAIAYGWIKKLKLARIGVGLNLLIEIVLFPFNLIFSVDERNIYHRENLYWLYIIAFSVLSIYAFYCIWCQIKMFRNGIDIVFVMSLFLFVISIIVQMLWSNLRMIYLAVSMCNFLFYECKCKYFLQTDALTLFLNRRCYENDLSNLRDRSIILLFDINKFKTINDQYGHLTGDRYLKVVADLICSVFEKVGNCYRIGGDEFCVIMEHELDSLDEKINQFKEKIRKLKITDEKMPDVAVGYAIYTPNISDPHSIVTKADEMMYRNKTARL